MKSQEKQLENDTLSTQITTRLMALFFVFVVILLSIISEIDPALAEYGNPYAKINLEYDLSLDRQVTTPVNLENFNLHITPLTLSKIKHRQHLLQLNNHIRDIARYLGTGWPINITLDTSNLDDNAQGKQYMVTDIKRNDGQWVTISAGYALNLVTQQLQFLEQSNGILPTADFLVKQEDEVVYHPLLNLPISVYLAHVLEDQTAKLARK